MELFVKLLLKAKFYTLTEVFLTQAFDAFYSYYGNGSADSEFHLA
jgi:hypothetical protein